MKTAENLESDVLNRLDHDVGFGCFYLLILFLGGGISLCSTLATVSVSLVMPVNGNDLELSSSRKGGIEACLFVGMLVGTISFGWLADAYGRRTALLWALPLTGAGLLFSAFSFHWVFFLLMVFFIGVGTGGCIPSLLTYVAECSAERFRGPFLIIVMSCQDISIAIGTFLAWALMGSNSDVSQMSLPLGSLHFVPWRLFLVLCSCFVVLMMVPLFCAPESPLFLLHKGHNKKLQELLDRMQRLNSCGCAKCCLTKRKANGVRKCVSKTELLQDDSHDGMNNEGVSPTGGQGCSGERPCGEGVEDKDHRDSAYLGGGDEKREQLGDHENEEKRKQGEVAMEDIYGCKCGRAAQDLLRKLIELITTFYCSSRLYITIVLHVVFFTSLFGYYGAKLWYPEIFKRIPLYKDAHPFQIKPHSAYLNQTGLQVPYVYYQDTLFIALSTIPSSIIGVAMFRVIGAKIFLVSSGIVASAAGITMWFVPAEHTTVLALCCVYNASISLALSVLKIGTASLYSTTVRSTALGLHNGIGRLGALAANIVFGELVDTSVALPMLLSAGMILLGTGVGLLLPAMYTKRDEPILYKCISKVLNKVR